MRIVYALFTTANSSFFYLQLSQAHTVIENFMGGLLSLKEMMMQRNTNLRYEHFQFLLAEACLIQICLTVIEVSSLKKPMLENNRNLWVTAELFRRDFYH